MEVVLVTGRTLKQGLALERGKLGEEYLESVSYCELNPVTMSTLGVQDGDPIEVETLEGSVIVRARQNPDIEVDTAFIPAGPFANAVLSSYTYETGMPDFKGTPAKIFQAEGRSVLTVTDLLRQMMGETSH